MAVRTSTGFAAAILGPRSFDSIFRYGMMEIRTGPQPDSADLPPTGDRIARITANGGGWSAGSPTNGLQFVRDGRMASKDFGQSWRLAGEEIGIAGWFRLLPNEADPGTLSLTAPRIDGAIGIVGDVGDHQIFLPSIDISPSTVTDINDWWYALPPLGA